MWRMLLVLAVAGLMAPGAYANDCRCLLPSAAGGDVLGRISAANGDVMISMPAGYARVGAGAPIAAGSTVMIGKMSMATFDFGPQCRFSAEENMSVLIAPNADGTCVSTEDTGGAANGDGTAARVVVAGATAAGIGGGIAAFATNDGDSVSK